MKYEAPELLAVMAGSAAIRNTISSKNVQRRCDCFIQPGSPAGNEPTIGYEDWE